MTREELEATLSSVRSRGQIKALGRRFDADHGLRAVAEELASRRGVEGAAGVSGKRLVRLLLDREAGARVRSNPIHRDTAFTCAWCGAEVAPGGARVRDHCPRCLRSLHLDVVPGDRAADCGGVMVPQSLDAGAGGEVRIRWRCGVCGHRWRGRAHPEDELPSTLLVADMAFPPGAPAPAPAPSPRSDPARTLPLRVLEVVRVHQLWQPGELVVLAVSGGVDSVSMMHLLAQLQRGHGGQLLVASVDHGLRPEAAAEVAMVGRQAGELGLPFRGLRLDVAPGPDLMARARAARQAALRALGGVRIATGHHLDDQAETVLYRMLRGSGAQGLSGMSMSSGVWCRPLLTEPRALIRSWATQQGLNWVEDPSNPASLRGRIRALIPQLDALHGGAVRALARSGSLIAQDDDFIESIVDGIWDESFAAEGIPLTVLAPLAPAVATRLLRRLVAAAPIQVRADQITSVLRGSGSGAAAFGLRGGWALVRSAGRLKLTPPGGPPDAC